MAREQGQDRHVVRVPERGHADVEPGAWQRLSMAPEFWGLVERHILTVSFPRRGRARLSGGSHVGRADIDGVALELHEKVPGALASLLRHLGGASLRTVRTASPVADLNELARFLIGEFLRATREYVGRGRERRYVAEPHVGSLVGGRLDVTRSLRLRARGLPHLVAFDRNELVFDTPLNRVVYAALRESEQLDRLLHLAPHDLAMARALSVAFADCRDAEILRARRDALVQYAADVAERTEDETRRDLATLAGVVLAHESFSVADPSGRLAPRAWFLNLERLFESAVRAVLSGVLKASCEGGELWPRERVPRRIFSDAPQGFTANPDLVIEARGTVAVGDVKYKTWGGTADASDLYQLLVHAKTYDAERCFLVYPHHAFDVRFLGRARTGCDTWLFAINIGDVENDVRRVAEAVGALGASAPAVQDAATHVA